MEDFLERLIELVKEDQELHDAAVRMLNAIADEKEIPNLERRKRLK